MCVEEIHEFPLRTTRIVLNFDLNLVHCLLSSFIFQCGFNPLYFAENQWVKTTLEDSKTQRNLIDNVLSTP